MQTPTIMTLPFPDGGAGWGASWTASGGIGVGVIRRCEALEGRTVVFKAGGGVFRDGAGVCKPGNGVCKDGGLTATRVSGVPAGGVFLSPAFILKPLLPR